MLQESLQQLFKRMATVSAPISNEHSLVPAAGSPSLLQTEVKQENVDGGSAIDFDCSPQFLTQIIEVIEQFCHKYLESFSQMTVNHILRKLSKVGEGISRQKGVRQLVAAVVYCQYSGVIRLKLKDYALMNQLNQKTFNRKYVAYQTILKKQAQATKQKLEDSTSEKEEEVSNDRPQGNQPQRRQISNPKQAIELIYDGIFKSYYFQDNRRQLIEKMAERCQEIDRKVYDEMNFTPNYSIKLFYAIYAHLKQFGMNIGFAKFREAVAAFAGFHLKRTYATITEKILKSINRSAQSEKDSSSIHSESESVEGM